MGIGASAVQGAVASASPDDLRQAVSALSERDLKKVADALSASAQSPPRLEGAAAKGGHGVAADQSYEYDIVVQIVFMSGKSYDIVADKEDTASMLRDRLGDAHGERPNCIQLVHGGQRLSMETKLGMLENDGRIELSAAVVHRAAGRAFDKGLGNVGRTGTLFSGRSWTVEAWVKIPQSFSNRDKTILGVVGDDQHDTEVWDGPTGYQACRMRALHITIRDRFPYLGFYGTDLRSSRPICCDQWEHLAFVYDLADRRQLIYVNGDCVGQQSSQPLEGDLDVSVGAWRPVEKHSQTALQGEMLLLNIWSHARTASEIKQSMSMMPSGEEEGLVVSWSFQKSLCFDARSGSMHELEDQQVVECDDAPF